MIRCFCFCHTTSIQGVQGRMVFVVNVFEFFLVALFNLVYDVEALNGMF